MNKISASSEDYLKTIVVIGGSPNQSVRSVEIARRMRVSKTAASKALAQLKKAELVEQAHHGRKREMPFVPSVLQTRRRRGSRNATVNSQPFTSFPLPTITIAHYHLFAFFSKSKNGLHMSTFTMPSFIACLVQAQLRLRRTYSSLD